MAARARGTLRALTLTIALVAVACGDGTESAESSGVSASDETGPESTSPAVSSPAATGQVASGPAPTEMCGAEGLPAVAAYDLSTGAFRWVACSTEDVRRGVVEASDEAVYLEVSSNTQELVAYDAADGTELPDGGPAESQPTLPDRTGPSPSPVVDGVRIEGGQDDPTTAVDVSTGDVLWTRPGSPAYDGLWAVGDGAVYVINRQGTAQRLVAYELTSGDVRWEIELDPTDVSWPWHVDSDVLFAIWTNLDVISTDDGSTIWRTQYPVVDFPRMTGVRSNSDTVLRGVQLCRVGRGLTPGPTRRHPHGCPPKCQPVRNASVDAVARSVSSIQGAWPASGTSSRVHRGSRAANCFAVSAPPFGSSSPQKQYTGLVTRASNSSVNNISWLMPLTGVIILGVARISFRIDGVYRSSATNQSSISALNLPESMAPFNPTWRSIILALARLMGIRAVIWPMPGMPANRMTSGVWSIGTPIDQLYNTTRPTRSGAAAAPRRAKNPPKEVPNTWAVGTPRASSRSGINRSPARFTASMSALPASPGIGSLNPHPGRSRMMHRNPLRP